ncbi:MAG: Polysaccharide export outer membrane protein [Mucilaginibacter sp.]|jgi:polysaccharide export outer membrane protein|nr:Polysaccharide export outer membrane protein [Mucilaginibacter sp.]
MRYDPKFKSSSTFKPMKKTAFFTFLFLAVICMFLCSCGNTKKLIYFQDIPEAKAAAPVALGNYSEPIIQPDDILAININTTDPAATVSINSRNGVYVNGGSNPQNGSANPLAGYLVDKNGNVEVPVIGTIKIAGLTTSQARAAIKDRANHSFIDPVVDVRFSNFKVTVIGEVNHPAAYIIPNEQVTLLDAIGYAGDLTIYGRRTNVLLIRKQADGKNVSVRLDMTKKEMLSSPYFYLKQNDIVYVEPLKTKVLNNDNNLVKYLSLAATLFTAALLAHRYW